MGKKSKRKTAEDPVCEGQGTMGDDQEAEGAVTTPSKRHKKRKKSKEKDKDMEEHATRYTEDGNELNPDTKEKKKKRKRKSGADNSVEEDLMVSIPKKQKLGSEEDSSEKNCPSGSTGDCSSDVAQDVRHGNCKKETKKKKKSLTNEELAVSATLLLTDTTANGLVSQPEEFTMGMKTGENNTAKSGKVCRKHKKEKKKPKQDVVSSGSDVLLETESQGIFTDSPSKNKKKGKKKHSEDTPLVDNNVETTEDDSSPKKKKKQQKRNKSELQVEASVNGLGERPQEDGTDSTELKTKRKKGKKSKLTADEDEENGADKSDVNSEDPKEKKGKKKKKEEKSGVDENATELASNHVDSAEITSQKKKSKKKRKSQNVEENTDKSETANPDNKDLATETKKKKRKTKDKEQNPRQESVGGEICNENAERADGKQKDISPLQPGEIQTDPGQTDRAQGALPTTIGQWGTSMFKDSERQNKFLRLLGGFKKAGDSSSGASDPKKGLFGSLQNLVGGQRAMTYQAAQVMDRRLESDYERALSFSARGQRGIGLGFTPDPAEGKKFHIDVNKVTSKKFD